MQFPIFQSLSILLEVKAKLIFKMLVLFMILAIVSMFYYQRVVRIYYSGIITERVNRQIHKETKLRLYMETAMGGGCVLPKLDPYAPEVMQFHKVREPLTCSGEDWVWCQYSTCRVKPEILASHENVSCVYRDLHFHSDLEYSGLQFEINHKDSELDSHIDHEKDYGDPITIAGSEDFLLNKSDHATVTCVGIHGKELIEKRWQSVVTGLRRIVKKRHSSKFSVAIVVFKAISRLGFIRNMGQSYAALTEELGAVVMEGYHVVGEGTANALYPMLSNAPEDDFRGRSAIDMLFSQHVDSYRFIWNYLSDVLGYFQETSLVAYVSSRYETAFLDGTTRQTGHDVFGFTSMPTDHYMRPVFKEIGAMNPDKRCVGATPAYQLILNVTDQFIRTNRSKFVVSMVSDPTDDTFGTISVSDDYFAEWLRSIAKADVLDSTLLVVMSDHGSKFDPLLETVQGLQEERLPLMAIVLPRKLVKERPEALKNLKINSKVVTSPFDLHATMLEVLGLAASEVPSRVDDPRSLSLIKPITASRSCPEAGIDAHWCTCVRWQRVATTDPHYWPPADALLRHINRLTDDFRSECAAMSIESVEHVMQAVSNDEMFHFVKSSHYGDVKFVDKRRKFRIMEDYSVKIRTTPGDLVYTAEARCEGRSNSCAVETADVKILNEHAVSSECISNIRPDLKNFCVCKKRRYDKSEH